MPDRIRLVIPFVAATVGVAFGVVYWPGYEFVVVSILFALAHFVPMPSPSGRGVSLAPGVAGGVALTFGGSPVMVLATAAASLPLARLIVHLVYGRRATQQRFPSEPAGILVFGALFAGASFALGHPPVTSILMLSAYLGAGVVGFLATAVVRSVSSVERRAASRRLLLSRALQDWPAFAVLFSAAGLYGITSPVMGSPWAELLAGFPYAFGYLALHRLQATRDTYDQTIRVLGEIPEAGGMVPTGHSQRAADLAVAIGAEMGLGGAVLKRLEYAGLLHDIGRLVMGNPAVAGGSYSLSDVSQWSAAIISEARFLQPVATIVANEHQPYRRPGEERDLGLALESKILLVAAAYDGEMATNGRSPIEALEVLHRGAAYEYDPEIVQVLRRVLERRGTIAA